MAKSKCAAARAVVAKCSNKAAPRRAKRSAPAAKKCAPLRAGTLISGSPSWDASVVAKFRVMSTTGKTALVEHVSGYNPFYGGKTKTRAKVTCYGGRPGVFLNPSGGRNTGIILDGVRR